MSTATQEFKNNNISATINHQPGCRVHLDVVTTPLATQAAFQKAIKMVSKEVSIPGFRKGKAPQETILKNYGKHVEREWKDLLLNTSFSEAIQLTKAYPFKEGSVSKASIKNISLQDGAKLVFEYEAAPSIPHVKLEDLSIENIKRTPIAHKDIENTIESLRLQHAQWSEVINRPAAENDFVDITIDSIETPEYNICKNSRFEIAAGKMGTWMRHLIIGMTPGQSAEKVSEKEPEEADCKKCESGEHHHEHDHFKPTLCRITLHSIKTPTMPDLDDEFAKKFGIQTYDELKKRVEEDLNKQSDEEQTNALRKLMEDEILTKYQFDIPRTLVEEQIEDQTEQITHELKEKNLEGELLENKTKKIKSDVVNRLARDYRIYYLAQQIAQDYKIQISQEDLSQELMRQMWLQPSGQSFISKDMPAEEVRSRLYASLLVHKTLDYLIASTQKKLDQQ
ncbi:MAG: trigger factor [Parachlamydiaceae bacterium]|nr:trigger factor [Parachlamydiaceae bacterium]